MFKITNFLNQGVYTDPHVIEDPDALDGAWDDKSVNTTYREEIYSFYIHIMYGERFYKHNPPRLLSPSMIIMINYNHGPHIKIFPRLNYPAKSVISSALHKVHMRTSTREVITIHNIGVEEAVLVINNLFYILDRFESITTPTKKLIVTAGDLVYLYTRRGVVKGKNKFIKHQGADYFLDVQVT